LQGKDLQGVSLGAPNIAPNTSNENLDSDAETSTPGMDTILQAIKDMSDMERGKLLEVLLTLADGHN
jgi:hypothetical protein